MNKIENKILTLKSDVGIDNANVGNLIAKIAEPYDGRMHRRVIFSFMRQIDESHLWPVKNKFNATERAIQRLYRWERISGEYLLGLELVAWLDAEISKIVNSEI